MDCVSVLLPRLLLLVHTFTVTAFAAGSSYASSFTPKDKSLFWSSSPAGNYTFGFKLAQDGAGEYLLAIWHSLDANQTAIWWAAFGETSTVTEGATFNYTGSRIMQLYDPTSSSTSIWQSSNLSTSTNSLQFLDTGNLQLLSGNNTTAAVAWESFEDRRDTLMLAGLELDSLVNNPYVLQSKINQTSYGTGKYHMATSNLYEMYLFGRNQPNNQYVYMKDYNVTINVSVNGTVSVGNQLDGTAYTSNSPDLLRLSLDYDGNLRVYKWDGSLTGWVRAWELLHDSTLACRAGSPCGPFGLCGLNSTGTVTCSCPTGYTPVSSTDSSKGCISSRMPPGCEPSYSTKTLTMVETPRSDFYYNDLEWFTNIFDLDICKDLCISRCACMAAIYNPGSAMCFLKGNRSLGYLENGFSEASPTLLMKLTKLQQSPAGAPTATKEPKGSKGAKRLAVLIALIVAFAVVVRLGWALVVWWRGICVNRSETVAQKNLDALETGSKRYSYTELVEATNNFTEMLGAGGFGAVYRGSIKEKIVCDPSGELITTLVAVKRLKIKQVGKKEAMRQFKAEASTLSKIHHVNLVNLLGYCSNSPNREELLLVYEYMKKGSLATYLSAAHMTEPLPWSVRYSIAVGTAHGIAYLHHGCNPRILHCDIKPENVLLDEDFTPKVADFGLARSFLEMDQTYIAMSRVMGTRGYMAPEWLKVRAITEKADVFSFGIVLLELVHGLRSAGQTGITLTEWARQCLAAGLLVTDHKEGNDAAEASKLGDGHESSQIPKTAFKGSDARQQVGIALQQQLCCLRVALECTQEKPGKRPTMLEVLLQIREVSDGHYNSEELFNPDSNDLISTLGH